MERKYPKTMPQSTIKTPFEPPVPRFELPERNERNLEAHTVVWLDANVDKTDDNAKTKVKLRRTINYLKTFDNLDVCLMYMSNIKTEKVFLIVSGSLGEKIVPLIQQMPQVESIYVFCSNKTHHEKWAGNYKKVTGIYTEIDAICNQLGKDVARSSNNELPMSVMPTDASNKQEASFMYFRLLIDILLRTDNSHSGAKRGMISECRQQYAENDVELANIDDFEKNYSSDKAIWWYTRECFVYRMLNKALRISDIDMLFKLRFFIKDLHNQLEQLHLRDKATTDSMIVYRGQGMVTEDFQKLRTNIGGFLSMNIFLSTATRRDVALSFAQLSLHRPAVESVLFEMTIDTRKCPRPFHNVENMSYFRAEQEILFSLGTVFRIVSVKQLDCGIWNVKLILNGEEDDQLRRLTNHMKKEIQGPNDFFIIGKLLLKMGEYDRAEQFHLIMLENISDNEPDVGYIYNQLGLIYRERGNNQQALVYYTKSLDFQLKYVPENLSSLAITYSNIGGVYQAEGDQEQALLNMEKALQIKLKTLPTHDPLLAIEYNNIAVVYDDKKEYDKALQYYHKSLSIAKAALPANHPSLAITYSNIGLIHKCKGDYGQALKYYEMTLEIQLSSLPSQHLSFRVTYGNIGSIYYAQRNYLEALKNFTQAYEIAKKGNHPDSQKYQKKIEEIRMKEHRDQ
ncbi:unnamed protein product [Didymodactylos carnosus]|uniref:NAD(P)(+)--arginine ADP-ribosyltransferase n=1 Tax=Didymodactylos carnosus TaxID=1234261 RepID=A0A8S2MD88_9BILA|nr:unnamed protein product [Didymodactylos carnosus]CAF3952209.1 unnamed protein product [Didymodactylos carnosus]